MREERCTGSYFQHARIVGRHCDRSVTLGLAGVSAHLTWNLLLSPAAAGLGVRPASTPCQRQQEPGRNVRPAPVSISPVVRPGLEFGGYTVSLVHVGNMSVAPSLFEKLNTLSLGGTLTPGYTASLGKRAANAGIS